MLGHRTLVKLDVENYADLARMIESATDATIVSLFNQKIQQFSEEALKQIGLNTGYIIQKVGDSTLIGFESADEAHKFSITVHQLAIKANSTRHKRSQLFFRIGCATGEIDLETYSGHTNTVACRLEPKADPGGILVDSSMYQGLSPEFQHQYDVEEIIDGKRDEKYHGRRWLGVLNSKRSLSGKKSEPSILNRILDIPEIPNSHTYSFETVTLNTKAEVIRREPKKVKYLIESIGEQELQMVIIPSGEYGMGSSERKALACEKPQHQVKIAAFSMSQHPITKAQWKIVATWPIVNHPLKQITSRKGAMNTPVVNVSWHDAVEFCDRLSLKAGKFYRLPTEAEWEYACRSGKYTSFHFGETISAGYANYDGTIKYYAEPQGIYREKSTPISEFKYPNQFGLFDMHGNVWEWCLDHWYKNYNQAPLDGQARINSSESRRVLRGGSFRNEPHSCTASYRLSNNESDKTGNNIGFRIVKAI